MIDPVERVSASLARPYETAKRAKVAVQRRRRSKFFEETLREKTCQSEAGTASQDAAESSDTEGQSDWKPDEWVHQPSQEGETLKKTE